MNPPVRPHPLTPVQRLQLAGFRLFIWVLGFVARWRRRAVAVPIEVRRYGTLRDETLECLHPAPGAPARSPVVYVHGGGWIIGRKELYTRDLAFLAERGHPVYNLDYPLAPAHPHPQPLRSLLEALAWLHDEPRGIDAVHVIGDSAGGNLALMLGLLLWDGRLRERLLPDSGELALPRVLGVVSLYGVLDRLTWLEDGFPGAPLMLQSYAGAAAFEPAVGAEASVTPLDLPIETCPPTFLAAGTRDALCRSTRLAHERLLPCGQPALRLEIYEGEPHGFFNASWRPNSALLRAHMLEFIDQVEEATDVESEAGRSAAS